MQRVLHIVSKMDRAGAETMLMNLYRHIDRSQFQFDFTNFTPDAGDYDDEILAMGGRIIPIIASNPASRMRVLMRFLRQHPEYRIVHSHMLLSNAFHLLAAKGAGVPHLISHSHNTSSSKSTMTGKIYERWSLMTNRKVATYKIACGELAAKYLFGTKKEVWLLPNAVDINKMMAIADGMRNYISETFYDKGLKLIQVGRLSDVKNHEFSLKIAELLKDRNIDFTLYIVGQGDLEDELRHQVQRSALTEHVQFLGVRTDITELMASADYMLMPSLHEGFPVVLVESQTVGLKALVSTQVSSEVDLGLGLVEFLPIDDPRTWVEALLDNKELECSKDKKIQILKSNGFDVSENAKKLAQVYESL
ncbi:MULTISPECIES: glycosyltransferase [unclassified Psychrobacter]|uniref:glycosyltransferase n=1 Tax=unclassified Psychrobacter TaxID=196806 RepID=UPI003FD206B4